MNTPIADFVRSYADSGFSRFHMPGHKGVGPLGCEPFDITEISGADVLSSANGIIRQSENNASSLFNSKHTFYSTEGSTLAIKAMLAVIKKKTPSGRRTTVLAARNVHKAFIYACALLDVDVQWLYPKDFTHLCSCNVNADLLSERLSELSGLPDAVYITSPDYLGNVCDVEGLSKVCRPLGIPLLVDNAHGAYLAFTGGHPLLLGADMCCDSAHKTLPVLTGGAYLHVSKDFEVSEEQVRSSLELFASTSPSYLVLQSLDLCNAYLANGYTEKLGECLKRVSSVRRRLAEIGFPTEDTEPLKLVFSREKCGFSGIELAVHLRGFMIEPEFADGDYLVLMVSTELEEKDFCRLEEAFSYLACKCKKIQTNSASLPLPEKPEKTVPIREAVFSDSEIIPVAEAEGRVCASPTVSCPPAVPVVMSGEKISKSSIDLMLHYGIDRVEVISENKIMR